MFENRGSPTKQNDLEEEFRHILRGQSAVRFDRLYSPLNSRLGVGAYLSKNGPPVYSLDINEQAEAVETINRVGQVSSAEPDIH